MHLGKSGSIEIWFLVWRLVGSAGSRLAENQARNPLKWYKDIIGQGADHERADPRDLAALSNQ